MKCFYEVPTAPFNKHQSSPPFQIYRVDERLERLSLSRSELAALDFFVTAFVWFDTLSCATTGSYPSCPNWLLPEIHEENGKIQIHRLMGCKNWAIAIIMEIAALETWKTECQQKWKPTRRTLYVRFSLATLHRWMHGNAGRRAESQRHYASIERI